MEGGVVEKQSSYTYWVREGKEDAAPLPVPRKLSADELSKQPQPATLGSVWNQAGTWEEKNLNSWATNRIKELLKTLASLEFSSGKAYIEEVLKCSGDDLDVLLKSSTNGKPVCWVKIFLKHMFQAFLIAVRNKKRVGYTYELTLKFKGEWLIQKEKKKIKGHLDIPEFSFGELEDLQIEVRLSEDKDLTAKDTMQIRNDLRLFLTPIREKLEVFEQELKDR